MFIYCGEFLYENIFSINLPKNLYYYVTLRCHDESHVVVVVASMYDILHEVLFETTHVNIPFFVYFQLSVWGFVCMH